MARDHGPTLVSSLAGQAAYWARQLSPGDTVQHSFWLFENEADAREAERVFGLLRDMPEAPAEIISVDVCDVISHLE